MPISNKQIVEAFLDLAVRLELEGDNPYRVRAYRRAAYQIEHLPLELNEWIKQGHSLTEIKYVGKNIAEYLATILSTNQITCLTEISVKKPKIIANSNRTIVPKSIRLFHVINGVESILTKLKNSVGFDSVIGCGPYRRKTEVLSESTILIRGKANAKIISQFITFPEIKEVLNFDNNMALVKLHTGLVIKLKIIPKNHWGTAIVFYTGSEQHVQALQRIFEENHMSFREQVLRKGKDYLPCTSEKQFFKLINYEYIPPELRENRGEIEKSKAHQLPILITINDIKGDLHSHTEETDGSASLEIMVNAASQKGYEYVAITDHSKRLVITNGLDEKRLLKQIKQIDKLNEKISPIRILKSIEVDILEDGSLDLSNNVLKELDLTVCSIHSKFRIAEEKQTERILRAMDNPYFTILGHATGRLINKRDPYELNLERIFHAAKERNCFIELNAQPYRLDINDVYCKLAKQIGVKFAISTDAHSTREFDFMQYGIFQARRGWLEPNDVINTRSLNEFLQLIKRN